MTLSAEVKGDIWKRSTWGEKSTTQQRKPYFIKLENKILGTKRFFKKRNVWKRVKCKWSWSGWSVASLYVPEKCVGTHTTTPTHIPLDQKPIQLYLLRYIQAFPSAFSSWFHLRPWTVMLGLCWRKLRFSNHRPTPQSSSFSSWEVPSYLHSPGSQGPLVQAHLKEKCQTFRTSYFIKWYQYTFQKDFIVVASKACTCFVFTLNTWEYQSNISILNLNRRPRPFKKIVGDLGKAVIYSGFKTVTAEAQFGRNR